MDLRDSAIYNNVCNLQQQQLCRLLFRLSTFAVVVVGLAAASTCGLEVLVVALLAAFVVFITTWRAILPRKVWEDPSIVGVNRLATHSRLGNYPTFRDAMARGQSPNVVSLRYYRSTAVVGLCSPYCCCCLYLFL